MNLISSSLFFFSPFFSLFSQSKMSKFVPKNRPPFSEIKMTNNNKIEF